MTLHLPSRRLLIAAGIAAALAAVALVVAVYWQTIVLWLGAAAVFRWVWRRHFAGPSRHKRRTLLETVGVATGGLVGWRGLRAEGQRRQELHAAQLEVQHARADELRSRTEHRVRTRAEQARAERAAWLRGFAEGEHSR